MASIDNVLSNERKLQAGVPQAPVLSPTLYSIYITAFKLRNNYTAALYADDTALITSGKVSHPITKYLGKSLFFAKKKNILTNGKLGLTIQKHRQLFFPFNKSSKRIPSVNLMVFSFLP